MDSFAPPIASRRWLVATLVLGALGFVANGLGAEIFFDVNLFFGSVFSCLALLRFGPAAGMVTTALAASGTCFVSHHPWTALICCGEGVFLAFLYGRRSRNVVLLDVLFWSFLGAPLLWYCYRRIVGIPPQGTTLIALKQSINGVLNVVVATIAQLVLQYRQQVTARLPRLRHLVFVSMVALVLVLVLTDLLIDLGNQMHAGQDQLAKSSEYLTGVTKKTVSGWLDDHLQDLQTLALLVGDPETIARPLIQQHTETVKAVSPAFRLLAVLNRNAVSIANAPLSGEDGTSYLNMDFSDRPYIQQLEKNKRPYVADLLLSRHGSPVPILVLMAPLVAKGSYRGYCAGVVDLGELRKILDTVVWRRDAQITLLDRGGLVIVSTRPELKTMEPFVRPSGSTVRQISKEVRHWLPADDQGKSALQRWRDSYFVQESTIDDPSGWTIIVEQSLVPLLDQMTEDATNILLMAAAMIVLSVGISHLLSRGLVRSLGDLQAATAALPYGLPWSFPEVWPKSGICEMDGLITNFRQMARALHDSFGELRALNESLEERVGLRTVELAESEQRYRLLADNAGDLIFRYQLHPEHVCLYSSPASIPILGYTPQEYYDDVDLPFKIVHPDDLPFLEQTKAGMELPDGYKLRWTHRDGHTVWMDTRITLVRTGNGSVEVVGISRDVSEQKRREDLIARLESEQVRRQLLEKEREHLRDNEMLMKDLHDGIGGIVTNIAMLGQYALLKGEDGPGSEIVAKIVELASAGVTEIRSFMNSTENRDSAWADLLAEIKEFAGKMLDPHGIRLEVSAQLPPSSPPLGSFRYVNLIRICREVVTNIVKHAKARSVRIDFALTVTHFTLQLSDDGVGYDQGIVKSRGTGNIRLRAEQIGAALSVVSTDGTTIGLRLPLDRQLARGE